MLFISVGEELSAMTGMLSAGGEMRVVIFE
jgi:hypothetical protein